MSKKVHYANGHLATNKNELFYDWLCLRLAFINDQIAFIVRIELF